MDLTPIYCIDDVVDRIVDTWPLAWCRLEAVEHNEAAIW